jgi:putative flippase GtrA
VERTVRAKLSTALPRLLKREHVFGQILRFGLVGGLNTVIDYGIFNLLHSVLGWPPVLSTAISVAVAIVNSFVWNRHWTFKAAGQTAWQRQLPPFLAISLVGWGISVGGFWIIHSISGADSVLAVNLQKVGANVISLAWNFLGYRFIAFRPQGRRDEGTSA